MKYFNLKTLSTVIIGQAMFSFLSCSQKVVSERNGKDATYETQQASVDMTTYEDEVCPVAPESPYWYDPNQTEVTFSDDGDSLLRFPRIKKGGDYVVPKTVKYIEERAFMGCRNLQSLTVPPNVKHIEMAPFESCEKLEKLVIQCQLGTLPFRFAGGCCSLRDIYLADKEPPFIEECSDEEEEQATFDINFYGINTDSCTIHVPRGSAGLYRSAPVWRMFKHFVES